MREEAETILRRLAGEDARLRDDQWTAIEALVAQGRRVLCVQRTGWGKSAVYFVATALLRARGAGPSVIVSPLLALMRNQIDAAARAGVHARTINSANLDDWDAIVAEIHDGLVDVLLISPERLNNPDFRDSVLPRLAATTGLLVVDEAHCVSDWGHDFRPDYRRLRTLLADLPSGVPVLATTATANERVTHDVAEQLSLPFVRDCGARKLAPRAHSGDALVLRGPLDRESLRLSVLSLPSPAHRLAWLADHLDELPGSGIVYTLTVAAAQETADFLSGRGYAVAAYTGQADDADRRGAEADLLDNKLKALVATSALGMGFDKPDLGFVVHLGAPPSPIAYYQQVGRAGRALDSAEVVLLPGAEDAAIWRYFASLAFPPEDQVRAVLAALSAADRPLSTAALEPRVELRRARLEMMLKVLDVDGAVRRVRGGWTATGQPWAYDGVRHRRIAEARAHEQRLMREYADTSACRLRFLRECLDDPTATDCGRCDVCTGRRWSAGVTPEALAAAHAFLSRPGVPLTPRRMWPTGLAGVSGRIAATEQADPGRTVGRLADLGWGPRLTEVLAADGPVPDDVFAAVVTVLADWARGDDPWPARPVAVLPIASTRHPTLVADLAARIATVGRLRLLPPVVVSAPPDAGRANSAQRVLALLDVVTLPPLSTVDGPVLLVDDQVDSGWTMTLVARAVRRAGVPGVLPLALAATA